MYTESDFLLLDIEHQLSIVHNLLQEEEDVVRISFLRGRLDAYEQMQRTVLRKYQV